MSDKRERAPDAVAINPRYEGAKMSDVARAVGTDPQGAGKAGGTLEGPVCHGGKLAGDRFPCQLN